MLPLLFKRPCLGLEITSASIRLAAVSKRGSNIYAHVVSSVDLPAGMVSANYSTANVSDPEKLATILGTAIKEMAGPKAARAGLSLPDSIFRVQMLEFDDLPPKRKDREHLIRWRLDKAATFDTKDIAVRFQILRTEQKKVSILSCAMKRDVLAQYEAVLNGLGLEPWFVGPSSFNTLNFYASPLLGAASLSGLIYVTEDALAVIMLENGVPDFYRYKEIKRTGQADLCERIIREIEDSLHFYTHHMDRSQPQSTEGARLYLSGDFSEFARLCEGLRELTSMHVELLSPAMVMSSRNGSDPSSRPVPGIMGAALGAGGALW